MRKFNEGRIIIASNNPEKIKEIAVLLVPLGVDICSARDCQIEAPDESGNSFVENAVLKAEYYGKISGLPALADDSGLCIHDLDGFPGIHSARFAKQEGNFDKAILKIKEKLEDKNLQTSLAFFVCALALRWPDGYIKTFEGRVEGSISFPPLGYNGLGYDPIFTPAGFERRFAQMSSDEKNQISHRSIAFRKLKESCL